MGKKRPKLRNARQGATSARESVASDSTNDELTTSTLLLKPQNSTLKVCRLCETKDGPFLNIFDDDNSTAEKIAEVMPFEITENDCLPHKICFRCSAKVEELYEFIHKCAKTQQNLQATMGKRTALVTKTKTRELWEEKLNKTNLSNEDICNALIKKAMEGIKDIPVNTLPLEEEKAKPPSTKANNIVEPIVASRKDKEFSITSIKNSITYQSDGEPDEVTIKIVKSTVEKCDNKARPITRTSRSKPEPLLEGLVDFSRKFRNNPPRKPQTKVDTLPVENKSTNNKVNEPQQLEIQASDTSVNIEKVTVKPDPEKVNAVPEKQAVQATPPPINIMDHVSTIKVNGVGTLFLCKLCNRNFLKKEVVMTHGCAKNNVPKDNFLQNHVPPPEVPKPPTVKYIKMDKDFKKSVTPETRSETTESKSVEKKSLPDALKFTLPEHIQNMIKVTSGSSSKTKPPVRLLKEDTINEPTQPPPKANVSQENKNGPAVRFPGLPSLNSRYKLVPGPNNTYTLIEESTPQKEDTANNTLPMPKNKKRKTTNTHDTVEPSLPTHVPNIGSDPEIIEVDDTPTQPQAIQQPYPVGLFQTVPHHSGIFAPNNQPQPPAFTTPAMKKQSYTIVQTGNPSKLLISTKAQPVTEEPQKKKSRKSKPEESNKDSYSATIEDNAQPKDTSFFSFINVDPLLQPSYVLPTDNIIQESQISTSTPGSKAVLDSKEKDKYSCNMCGEMFSREKKLLAHIQSHYNQMDEEDQMRAKTAGPKKNTRKSVHNVRI